MKDHIPGQTDLAAIADRIKQGRSLAEQRGGIAFVLTLYLHESIDVEEALRSAALDSKSESK
jgi:hypothetical protein